VGFSYACTQDIWQNRLHFHLLSADIPQQLNGSDYGVFICMYARHLAEQISFSFTQSDINVISAFCKDIPHSLMDLIMEFLYAVMQNICQSGFIYAI